MSRKAMIAEIQAARKEARADLIYVKGLTKMRKEELSEILREIKKNKIVNPDSVPDLEREADAINTELVNLEDQKEQAETELDNLNNEQDNSDNQELQYDQNEEDEESEQEDEQEDEDEEEEYEEELKKPKKKKVVVKSNSDNEDSDGFDDIEKNEELVEADIFLKNFRKKNPRMRKKSDKLDELDDEEEKAPVKTIKKTPRAEIKKERILKKTERKNKSDTELVKEAEQKIRVMLKTFSKDLTQELKLFNKLYKKNSGLTEEEKDELIDFHNNKKDEIMEKIDILNSDLPETRDFRPTFKVLMETIFTRQRERVERLIEF